MGDPILILAFVVIVIGGIGSIRGALVGALWSASSTRSARAPAAALAALIRPPGSALARRSPRWIYVLMAAVLVYSRDRPVLRARALSHAAHRAAPHGAVTSRCCCVLALAVPLLHGTLLHALCDADRDLSAWRRVSLDLLLGYGGLTTFGQAAFFGVGAYAAGMLTVAGFHEALIVWPWRSPRDGASRSSSARCRSAPRASSSSWSRSPSRRWSITSASSSGPMAATTASPSPHATAFRRHQRSTTHTTFYYRRPRAARRCALCWPRASSVRASAWCMRGRRDNERRARRDRLPALTATSSPPSSSPARHRRSRRRAHGQPRALRQPGAAALDVLGTALVDGDPRRRRHARSARSSAPRSISSSRGLALRHWMIFWQAAPRAACCVGLVHAVRARAD